MSDPVPRPSYSQWVRRLVRRHAGGAGPIHLFGSATPEPTHLLQRAVLSVFAPEVSPRYAPTFASDNAFLHRALLELHADSGADVLAASGVTAALSLLVGTFAPPGTRVLVESPGLDLFGELAAVQGVEVDRFPRPGPYFGIDLDALAACVRPDTRLILLSDLHNPSGMRLDDRALDSLAALAESADLLCVIDEVYAGYAPARVTLARSGRFITVNSLTKVYGLPSLRCGWIAAAPALIGAVRNLADRRQFDVSRLAHAVAALVVEDRAPFEAHARKSVARLRGLFEPRLAAWREEGLIEIELPDFGGMFFPRLIGIDDSFAFAEWLIEAEKVLVAPGELFGTAGHVRLGCSGSLEEAQEGLDRLERGLRRFRASHA